MFARGFSPFIGFPKWTGLDTSRHGFTKFGAFPGAFIFTAPNVGNFLTASAIGNCEASVYVVLVSRMSLCRIIAIAMRGGTPARARFVASVCRNA
jgi:hypothetical protein